MAGINILFLTQTYPRFEGDTAGPFIRDLARGLVRRGDRVTVLAPHAPEVAAAWDDDGVAVETFRYATEGWERVGYSRSLEADESIKGGAAAAAPLYLLGARRALARRLAAEAFDVVHAHWVVPNAVAAAVPWLVRGARRAAFGAGLHGSDVFLAERPVVRRAVGRVLAQSDFLTGCSPELVDRVAALGFPRARARVIPYGVDVETFAPGKGEGAAVWRRRLGVPAAAPLVLSVGRMATKKGFQVLLEALPGLLRRFPDVHFVLAGSGDRLEEFRQSAAALPAGERVHFPGVVLRDTLPDLYRAANLFVLPAVHDAKGNVDGLPNVILEAMASGLPVVASGISGIPLAVEEGKTGLLVPEKDPQSLEAALARLLTDPATRRAYGEAGRAKTERELTWDAIAGRYRDAYLEAIKGVSVMRMDSG